MLGLPEDIRAGLFDLDGVLTDTASIHRAAWKAAFDPVLAAHGQGEFTDADYDQHVDGKPRFDGVHDLLAARGIDLSKAEMTHIADAKNADVQQRIQRDGVPVFEGSRRYLEQAKEQGLRRFVVSSSANTEAVLEVTGLVALVEGRVDGVTIEKEHLQGKPAPDSFLRGAELAGVRPEQAAVFEDALAGVAAGKAGRFGFVVGVNREDDAHRSGLREHGASVVVDDLADLLHPTKSLRDSAGTPDKQ